jgi:hypothetical protein
MPASVRVIEDLAPAQWIAPRLTEAFGAVTTTVPSGFDVYVRICHPAPDGSDEPRSWSEVASATGRHAHALMQWHALVGSADWLNMTGSLWEGGDPHRGNLAHEALAVLCDCLARHTATPEDCYFAVWEGWNGLEGYGWLSDADELCLFSPIALSRHRLLRLPHRKYLVLAGPLSTALRIGSWGLGRFFPQSPNLFWPADHTWCVASEIDFDSTLVGGTASLVKAILETPALDAWRVEPADSLACDADKINLVRE